MSASCLCSSPCQNCANVIFTDDFTSALGGYTDGNCPGAGSNHLFTTGGGLLTETFGGAPYTLGQGSHTQLITVPTLSTLCISICSVYKALTGKIGGSTGVFYGDVCGNGGGPSFQGNGRFYADTTNGQWVLDCFNTGQSQIYHAAIVDGDVFTFVMKRVDAAHYEYAGWVNGVKGASFTMVTGSLPTTAGHTVAAGVFDGFGGAWGGLTIATS